MDISNSDNVNLGGALRFKDSPMMHLVLNGIRSLFVSNVTIEAPKESPNTDGIHVQECTNAHIEHCTIGTGIYKCIYMYTVLSKHRWLQINLQTLNEMQGMTALQ